jgi:hypothetical protein
MEAGDELRAELERRQANDRAAVEEQQRLDRLREDWEREEEAVKRELGEMADLTVAALAKDVPTEKLGVRMGGLGISRLWIWPLYVQGWEVRFGGREPTMLCPDGTTVVPAGWAGDGGPAPRYSTLRDWVDRRVAEARTERKAEHLTIDHFGEAFRATPPGSRATGSQERHQRALRDRLDGAKRSVVEPLGHVLHERGISL